MNLTLLRQLPQLSVYYDSWNNWLFLDWQGELTLAAVQGACLALARCCGPRIYPRVLNSNAQVTDISRSVSAWLSLEFLPCLKQAGVEQLAWVRSASPAGQSMVQQALGWLPQLTVSAFDELEQAVDWLQQTQPDLAGGSGLPLRLPAQQEQLTQQVQGFIERVSAQLDSHPDA